jgi:three-Cys-motif partner protein
VEGGVSGSKEFFQLRRAQAVFKHGILSRYPTVFAAKTGVGGRRVVFLDGYAGRGEYEDGSPGSPLLLARTAAKVAEFRNVTGVYVEKDGEDYANLRQVMAACGRATDPVLPGDVQEHLPFILQLAAGAALFAFLDPFGTALDRAQLVGDLLGRPGRAPVEVLLHISISTVARLGGLLRRRREQGVEVLEPSDAKAIGHVDRFLGGQWWQEHFTPVRGEADEEQATAAALRVAETYLAGVCIEARCRAVSMQIRRRPDHLPKYVLVLFTRHGDGMWYFADALGKAGREWEGAWRTEVASRDLVKAQARYADAPEGIFDLEELFAAEPFDPQEYEQRNRQAWQTVIAGNIRGLLGNIGPFVLTDHIAEVYGGVLGAAGERHVRAAVKALHVDRVIANTGVGDYFFRELIRPVS